MQVRSARGMTLTSVRKREVVFQFIPGFYRGPQPVLDALVSSPWTSGTTASPVKSDHAAPEWLAPIPQPKRKAASRLTLSSPKWYKESTKNWSGGNNENT